MKPLEEVFETVLWDVGKIITMNDKTSITANLDILLSKIEEYGKQQYNQAINDSLKASGHVHGDYSYEQIFKLLKK